MENEFWKINFWGILGTMSGLLGMYISWLGYRHNFPKIKLGRRYLITNSFLLDSFKTKQFKDGDFFRIYTYFHAFNANSGPGSFERPTLRMFIGNEDILRLLPDYEGQDDRIVYLAGGEGKKIVQTYTFKFEKYRDEGLFQKMVESPWLIHYEMSYFDNAEVNHTIKGLQDHEPNKDAFEFFDTSPRLVHLY